MLKTDKYKGIVLLDTETANVYPDSMCQIAGYVIKDNEVIDKFDYYIKPEPNWFIDRFIAIHGITSEKVKDEPTFNELYPKVEQYFNGDYLIVAHNARFDVETVFKGAYEKQGINFGNFDYACTVDMLRKHTDWKLKSYALGNLTKYNNIHFNHHNAFADVDATLQVVRIYADSLENLVESSTKKGYKVKNFKTLINKN